jgi:hypothetical protein
MKNLFLAIFFIFAVLYIGVQVKNAVELADRRMSEMIERASK